jgi:Mg-chelatase subunit ChlD
VTPLPELLNPAGLFGLTLLPLLLLPYLLRQRPRRRVVPALFLYQGIEPARRLRLGGRLRLRPLFLLQLALLLAALGALCRPAWRSAEARSALVLDNSASLHAVEDSGESRFAAALRAARAEIARDPATTWDVFVLSPLPSEVGGGLSARQAEAMLGDLSPGGCAHPDDAILAAFFERLARRGYAAVHVVSDRAASSSDRFHFATVGRPRPNVAITDLTLAPPAVAGRAASLNVVVENFSARAAAVPIAIEDESGTEIRAAKLEVGPRGSANFTAEVAAAGRLHARISPGDALALDDEATTAAPHARDESVLLVAREAGGLDEVARTLGFRLEVVPPEEYRPALSVGRDLVIFHRSAPREPPVSPAIYLLPPDAPFLPAAAGRIDRPVITFAAATHPIARYLNPAAVRPRQVLVLRRDPGWQPLALADDGALILERAAPEPVVASGFDLLPYLGDRNRPVSILTLNLISWLLRGRASSTPASACTPIGRAESDLERPPPLPSVPPRAAEGEPTTTIRPLWPVLTLVALALLLLDAWLERSGGGAAWVIRGLVTALLVAAWAEPTRAVAVPPPRPLIVADVSRSLLAEVRANVLGEIRKAVDPAAAAVAFATRPVRTTLAEIERSAATAGGDATDLETALSAVADDGPRGAAVILVTDGWENRGQASRVLALLAERGLRVYPIASPQPLGGDVELSSLSLPAESRSGQSMRAELWLRNDNPAPVRGRLLLRQGAKRLLSEEVKLPPGDSVVARPLLVSGEGLLEFEAEFAPLDPSTDFDRDNDRAKAWVAVGGQRRLLLVAHEALDNRDLEPALSQRGFRVTPVIRAAGEPLPDLGGYAAVILNDVPLADLPGTLPVSLREFVREGGGLAMIGGPRSFGLGGYGGSAVEEALPVRMRERRRDEPTDSVALVIDKSGSMREERRISFAREAARQLVDHLKEHDRLTVIGFDREAFVVVPLSGVGEIRGDFERRIERLKPSGGTRLYPALEEARRQLLGEEARRRHIIVLSDGLSEDADSSAARRRYYDLALALSEQGVTISTIALGHEADVDFLERLASFGRGAFHETADASSLPEIVLGEFEEHAREKTLSERTFRPAPSRDSPLVGELASSEAIWPPVLGLVETDLKPGARRDVGVAESDVPLVASWQYGRGRSIAVTTDADGRWSDRWVRWKEWSRLWSDLADWLSPRDRGPQPRFAVAYRDGALEIEYSRFDQDPAGAVAARVLPPDEPPQEVPLQRVAAGHYRARFATRAAGDYRIELRDAHGPVTEAPLGFTIPRSIVAERPRREPDWAFLEELARRTAGSVNPDLARIPPAPAPAARTPLAPFLLAAAMILFLLELIVRRLRHGGKP